MPPPVRAVTAQRPPTSAARSCIDHRPTCGGRAGSSPMPVVRDGQPHLGLAHLDHHLTSLPLTMPGGVGQRLDRDPVRGRLHRSGQRRPLLRSGHGERPAPRPATPRGRGALRPDRARPGPAAGVRRPPAGHRRCSTRTSVPISSSSVRVGDPAGTPRAARPALSRMAASERAETVVQVAPQPAALVLPRAPPPPRGTGPGPRAAVRPGPPVRPAGPARRSAPGRLASSGSSRPRPDTRSRPTVSP